MSTTTCPHCGQSIQLTKANPALAMWHQRQTFESAVPAIAQAQPVPQFSEAERRTPARAASVESDVLVPATQALITGAVSMIPRYRTHHRRAVAVVQSVSHRRWRDCAVLVVSVGCSPQTVVVSGNHHQPRC